MPLTIATKSNYFHVKDGYAFRQWLASRCLDYVIKDIKGAGPYYAITADKHGGLGWPAFDCDAREEIDLPAELAVHLPDHEVAVLFEVVAAPGHQAVASAVAVRADGKVATLKTTDIYGIARKAFGKKAVIEGAVA
jgi:hypothetical protein